MLACKAVLLLSQASQPLFNETVYRWFVREASIGRLAIARPRFAVSYDFRDFDLHCRHSFH